MSQASEKVKTPDKTLQEESIIEELENEFQAVLSELIGDRSFDKFRAEYEKIFLALKKSHDNERRLMHKIREQNGEIIANATKVQQALKFSQDDQATIASLKKELEKAWHMVDAASERENQSKETISDLKMEIHNLTRLVEQGAGLSMGQENSVNELLKVKEELTKERDHQLDELVGLREKLNQMQQESKKMENERNEAAARISELKNDIQMRQNESQRESRRREKLERELKQASTDVEIKGAEGRRLQQQVGQMKMENSELEQQCKVHRVDIERLTQRTKQQNADRERLASELEERLKQVDDLASENIKQVEKIKQREDELTDIRQESSKMQKMRETIQRRLRTVEEQKLETEQNREILKSQAAAMERELDVSKKQAEQDKRAYDDVIRERDNMTKQMMKAAAATQKQIQLVKLHEQSKMNLEQEIQNYKDEAQKQRKIIYQLEKERDRYINEASELTQNVLKHMEDVKVREMMIFDYKKKIAEQETRLKQQQNLYEAVRSDRNLYSKNLIESQDEIVEMNRKLKITNHQIDQLKEEISTKEARLAKEHLELQRVEKQKEGLKSELQRMRQLDAENKNHIKAQENEQRKLLKIIGEADAERVRQKKELDQVIAERDILGTQLVRRNDELALLYEKIKIQQSTLNKGEIQYNQRLEDMRVLKLEIRKLRRGNTILQKSVVNVHELKQEVYHVQRELLKERTRCKALEEELENPMNIHRWRKLEGSDPSSYEMIQKVHTLQKRLIAKTEEVVEKELLIQERDKLYVELKHILARQPGPEVAEQMSLYQQTVKEKTRQLKSMASELNMYETQVSDHKFEIERLARELQDVKKKYFFQKKKEMAEWEREKLEGHKGSEISPQMGVNKNYFTGGGFKMKAAKGAA